ncbi:MAG TPA: YbaY family lipoprotein [Luteimonas sp.]|nr:YbaY family lipoprotein [Luteimonas sp.]
MAYLDSTHATAHSHSHFASRAIVLSAVLALSACASGGEKAVSPGPAAQKVSVSGTVLYRERIAMPPGSTVMVRLEDTALMDAPAKLLAEQIIKPEGQVPIPFQLQVAKEAIDARARPSLRATITSPEGRMLFTTTTHEAVDLSQDTSGRTLVLQRVASD